MAQKLDDSQLVMDHTPSKYHLALASERLSYADPTDPIIKQVIIRTIEFLSGKRKLARIYATLMDVIEDDHDFWRLSLKLLDVELEFDQRQLAKMPSNGPLVIVANHPFGVLDGLAICYLTAQIRAEFKVLAHAMLCRDRRLDPYLLPIEFSENRKAIRTNVRARQNAAAALQRGKAVIVFPSGGIATAPTPFGAAVDLEWKTFVAKVLKQSEAAVVPMFFHGQNSRLFQLVSQVSLTLRLSMIMHEVCNKIGQRLRVTIGNPLPFAELYDNDDRQALTAQLRKLTEELGGVTTSKLRLPAYLSR
ncbi:MAG: lysophospholipid acyltransferase family protein [Desulfobacterales bacterium]|jgi:putative hemolysin